jgi:hypothetical protein
MPSSDLTCVHIFWAIIDESQSLSSNAICIFCAGVITSEDPAPSKKPAPTSWTAPDNGTNNPKLRSWTTKKQPSSMLKKSKAQQGFIVEGQWKLKDCVLQKPVAFDTSDKNYGEGHDQQGVTPRIILAANKDYNKIKKTFNPQKKYSFGISECPSQPLIR